MRTSSTEKSDELVEDLIKDLVNNKLGVDVDYKFIVDKLHDEYVYRVCHLKYLTEEQLKELKLPLMIRILLKEYCQNVHQIFPNIKTHTKQQQSLHSLNSVSKHTSLVNSQEDLESSGEREEPLGHYFGLPESDRNAITGCWKTLTMPSLSPSTSSLSLFYDQVWASWTKLDPIAEVLFQSRGFKGRVQHLMRIMSLITICAEDPIKGNDKLQNLGVKHCIWNVGVSSFSALGISVIEGLEVSLGKETMTSEVREAWLTLITNIGEKLINQYPSVKKGWNDELYRKQGNSWSKVYTKLTDDTLYMYKSLEMRKVHEKCHIKLICDVSEVESELPEVANKPTPFCFCLQFGSIKKYYCSTSSSHMEDWIKHIKWRMK